MCSTTRELITLQVGHYANFVGTHWWNLQEASFLYDSSKTTDLNHDFLFREGLTSQRQETYTPRLLCIDVQGSLNTLSSTGNLYNPSRPDPCTSEAAWDGTVNLIHQLTQEKNEYLMDLEQEEARYSVPTDEDKDICLDDSNSDSKSKTDTITASQKIYDLSKSVNVWSDFLRPHLHPDAIYLLDAILVQGDRGAVLENEDVHWGVLGGNAVYQCERVEEEITDRIRKLAECCNSMQGFQVLSDIHNGMGGISSGILQHINDEYSSKDIITFTTSPPHLNPTTPLAKIATQAAIVHSYTQLSECSSVVVPLCLRKSIIDFAAPSYTFPQLTYQDSNAYLSSSVLGAFLETASSVYRMRTSPMPLSTFSHILTPVQRKIAGGSIIMPYDDTKATDLHKHFIPVSADANFTPDIQSKILSIRGITSHKKSRVDNAMNRSLCIEVIDPVHTTSPFPPIYAQEEVQHRADSKTGKHIKGKAGRDIERSVNIAAALYQSSEVGRMIQPLLNTAYNIDITKIPRLLEEGMDKDTWTNVIENLRTLVLDYGLDNDDMNSSTDDD